MKISLEGCKLGSACLSDNEISRISFDFSYLEAYPNILGSNKDEVVRYREDSTNHFAYLDPTSTQTMNIFFMESTLSLKDNIWDIFEAAEYEVSIVEYSHTTRNSKWMPNSTPVSERVYATFYLR